MQIDLVGRKFKVWEYKVSHSSLLIRSPAVDDCEKNIDMIFKGVVSIDGPINIGEVRMLTSITEEVSLANTIDVVRTINSWKLTSENGIFNITAAFMNLEENTMGLFESHFVRD